MYLAPDPPRGAVMRRLGGGQEVARRAGFMNRPREAPLVRADTRKPRHRPVERREAQAPTSLGLRISGGGPRGHARGARAGLFAKDPATGASQAPMGSRKPLAPPGAPSPRCEGRKKGRAARRPYKSSHRPAERWL